MTERTPLLLEQGLLGPRDSTESASVFFPTLENAAAALLIDEPLTLKHLHDLLRTPSSSSTENESLAPFSSRHAFYFSLLLYVAAPTDEEDEETSQLHNMFDSTIQTLTAELWTSYSQTILSHQRSGASPSSVAIRELLWAKLAVRDDPETNEREYATLAQLLASAPRPPFLLEQPLVVHEVQSAWRYGVRWPSVKSGSANISRGHLIFLRAISLVTPRDILSTSPHRVAHALDSIIYTIYIGTLAHILMKGLDEVFSGQDIFIIIYAALSLLPLPGRRWSFTLRLGYVFALFAYAYPPHGRPIPETATHAWLLAAFGWNALLLLAPISPGWVLLFHPRVALQPAVEFSALVRPVVITPLLYFLPVILFFVYLLSRVMDDPWNLKSLDSLQPAPYSTRQIILLLLLSSILLFIFYGFASLIRESASGSDGTSPSQRTRSALVLSPEATRVLLRNVLVYREMYFPVPLAIIPFILCRVPEYILKRRAERQRRQPQASEQAAFDDADNASASSEGYAEDDGEPADSTAVPSSSSSRDRNLLAPARPALRNLRRISMSIPGVPRQISSNPVEGQEESPHSDGWNVIKLFQAAELGLWCVLIWPPSIIVAGMWVWGIYAPVD